MQIRQSPDSDTADECKLRICGPRSALQVQIVEKIALECHHVEVQATHSLRWAAGACLRAALSRCGPHCPRCCPCRGLQLSFVPTSTPRHAPHPSRWITNIMPGSESPLVILAFLDLALLVHEGTRPWPVIKSLPFAGTLQEGHN